MKIQNLSYDTARRLSNNRSEIEIQINSNGSFNLNGPTDLIESEYFKERYLEAIPEVELEIPELEKAGEILSDLEFERQLPNVSILSLNQIGPISRENPPTRVNIFGREADLMDFDPDKRRYDIIETFDLSLEKDRLKLKDSILALGPTFVKPLDQMIDSLEREDSFLKFRAEYFQMLNLAQKIEKNQNLVKEATKEILDKTKNKPFEYGSNGNVEFRIPESDEVVFRNLETLSNGAINITALENEIRVLESEWEMHITPSEADDRMPAAKTRRIKEDQEREEVYVENVRRFEYDRDHDYVDDRLEMQDEDHDGIDDALEDSLEEIEIDEPEFERTLWGDDDD